jgi:hypothetical protein
MKLSFWLKITLLLLTTISLSYGAIRLYYFTTGGFTIGNISSNLPYDAQWETHPLSLVQRGLVDEALSQEYHYLGKGCQSYVFLSADGRYVVKFLKFQRFRTQRWIDALTFIPGVKAYQDRKAVEKKVKLDNLFRSWKIAFENLSAETGVVYVHLNKSSDLGRKLDIQDKMGFVHTVDLDQMEFLVQHRADMLCPAIKTMIAEGRNREVKDLIDRLLVMLLREYARGFADNDHALMQNTGVWQGDPVHIDAGQFIYNEIVKDPAIHRQELYDKTYKFHLWLEKHDAELASHLRNRLMAVIGEEYFLKGPYIHKSDVSKIPHQQILSARKSGTCEIAKRSCWSVSR